MRIWTNPLECKPMLRHTPMGQHCHKNSRTESFTRWRLCQSQCYQQNEIMMPMTGRLWGSLNLYNTGDIGYREPKNQLRSLQIIRISSRVSTILQHRANVICDGWRALRDSIVFTTIPLEKRIQWQTSLAEGRIITRKAKRNRNSTHSLRTGCSLLNN